MMRSTNPLIIIIIKHKPAAHAHGYQQTLGIVILHPKKLAGISGSVLVISENWS